MTVTCDNKTSLQRLFDSYSPATMQLLVPRNQFNSFRAHIMDARSLICDFAPVNFFCRSLTAAVAAAGANGPRSVDFRD
jgi:hypothetical protein